MFPCLFDLEKWVKNWEQQITLYSPIFLICFLLRPVASLVPWASMHAFFVYVYSNISVSSVKFFLFYTLWRFQNRTFVDSTRVLLLLLYSDRFQEIRRIPDIQLSQISNIRSIWTKKIHMFMLCDFLTHFLPCVLKSEPFFRLEPVDQLPSYSATTLRDNWYILYNSDFLFALSEAISYDCMATNFWSHFLTNVTESL